MLDRADDDGLDWTLIATLVAMTLIAPLSIHLFLPAIPAVRAEFGVAAASAQATFSTALFTMAAATLVYGSLSDRYGRRPVLIGGLVLFTLGALVSALAGDVSQLLLGRLIQGAGAACGIVLARAMLRDVYGIDKLVKAIAYLTAAYVVGPMVAPAIGGLMVDGLGWRAIFWLGGVAGLALVAIAVVHLPETHTGRGARPGMATILRGYGRLLGSRRFCAFAFQPGFASGAFFTHAAAASFLMTETLHRSAAEYGLYFLFSFPLGFMVANFIAGRLAGWVAIERMILTGALISFGASILLLAWVTLLPLTPLALFLPGGLHTFGQGLSHPNANTGALSTDRELAGTASGIVLFLQFFFGAAFSQLANGTTTPMLAVVLTASFLALVAACAAFAQRPR